MDGVYKEDGNYTYTDISIRFGGRINKNTWNEINTDYHHNGSYGKHNVFVYLLLILVYPMYHTFLNPFG